jgi:hypothetical protein
LRLIESAYSRPPILANSIPGHLNCLDHHRALL